jgi:hypothetical protein
MLLVRMPSNSSIRNFLIYIFITFRVVFSMCLFAMVGLMYYLMGVTVYFWIHKFNKKGVIRVSDSVDLK